METLKTCTKQSLRRERKKKKIKCKRTLKPEMERANEGIPKWCIVRQEKDNELRPFFIINIHETTIWHHLNLFNQNSKIKQKVG